MANSSYHPPPRDSCSSVTINGKAYIWGGERDGPLSTVDVFDGIFHEITTTGDIPDQLESSACAVIGNTIYNWGGHNDSSNALHSVKVGEWEWKKVAVKNPQEGPAPQGGMRMIAHGDNLVLVTLGQVYVFSTKEGMWSKPKVHGDLPPPTMEHFSLTKVDERHAVLYGGKLPSTDNDKVYILDFISWEWSLIAIHGPSGRRSHGATLLTSSPHPQLLITGGLGKGSRCVETDDAWVIEVRVTERRALCTKVTLPVEVSGRRLHTTTTTWSGDGSAMVVVDGGLKGSKSLTDTYVLYMAINRVESNPGEPSVWKAVEVVSVETDRERSKQLGALMEKLSTPITSQDPQFPGIHFLGTEPREETVTSEGKEVSMKDIGVSFSIAPGAVPAGESMQLSVRPAIAGPFVPPDKYQLTSPTYHVSRSANFNGEITVVIHHRVELKTDEDCKRMKFISAPSTTEHDGAQPHYKFKVLEGGVFRKNESFGTITLRQFSHLGTATDDPEPKVQYSALLYSNSQIPGGPCSRVIFCMVESDDLYITHVTKTIEQMEPAMRSSASFRRRVKFADSITKVTLEHPCESDTPGYLVVPESGEPLEIYKKSIDDKPKVLSSDYPDKLAFNVFPLEEDTTKAAAKLWKLQVLGLEIPQSFNLLFPISREIPKLPSEPTGTLTLKNVKGVLYDIRYKWKDLGIQLDFGYKELKCLAYENRHDLNEALDAMIDAWLRRPDPRASWDALVAVLMKKEIAEEEIAMKISKLYIPS